MRTGSLRASLLAVALAHVLVGAAACQTKVIRLTEQGRYEEAVRYAESLRRLPRGKAARAWAEALVALDRHEEALAVLLRDFRRGSNLESLVALADLELALGRRGTAAVHYERAMTIDPGSVGVRPDVCALLVDRARALLGQAQGLAAEETSERARQACGAPPQSSQRLRLQQLDAEIDAVADAQVDRRIQSTQCDDPKCREESAADRRDAQHRRLAEAAESGPRELWLEAQRQQAQVPVSGLVEILLAEVRGELGNAPLLDPGLATLVGAQTWTELAPTVMSLPPAEAAWVQLRLAPVVADMPVAPSPRIGADQLDRWADRVEQIDGAQLWRVEVFRGELAAAELELGTRLRPSSRSIEPAPGASAPSQGAGEGSEKTEDAPLSEGGPQASASAETATGPGDEAASANGAPAASIDVAGPDHWLADASLDEKTLPQLLAVARLRRAAGFEDLSLRARRHLLARAYAQGLDPAVRWTFAEVGRALAWGRFWEALALADAVPSTDVTPAVAAAANAVGMARIFCEGPCTNDEDLALVVRVMGQDWVDRQRDGLARRAHATVASRGAGRAQGCPTLAELTSPDATGPLPEALELARRDLDAPGVGTALVAAIEAEPAFVCRPSVVVPLLVAGGHRLPAQRVAEFWSHAPQMRSSLELQTHAELAMVAGDPVRAELLAVAAAGASVQPRTTWLSLARTAAATSLRDLELFALRHALLHTPGLHDPAVRTSIVLHGLRDAQRTWSAGEATSQALREHVESYLEEVPPAQRAARAAALAQRIVEQGWLRQEAVPTVIEALFPSPALQRRFDRLIRSLRNEKPEPPRSTLDVAGWTAQARAGSVDRAPETIELFADPSRTEALRLALAKNGRAFTVRWRSAIGLVAYGSPPMRLRGAAALRELVGDDAERTRALAQWWAAAPAVLEPTGYDNPREVRPATLTDDVGELLALVFGLDLGQLLVGY